MRVTGGVSPWQARPTTSQAWPGRSSQIRTGTVPTGQPMSIPRHLPAADSAFVQSTLTRHWQSTHDAVSLRADSLPRQRDPGTTSPPVPT